MDEQPNVANPPTDSPIDHDMLVRCFGPDQSMHQMALQQYRDGSGAYLEKIQAAVTAGDPESLQAVSHQMKSSSRYVGAMQVGALCEALESCGKSAEMDDATRLFDELQQAYESALAYIDTLD